MKKILVTGAGGQLAQCIEDAANHLQNPAYRFIFLNREHLDITNRELVETYFFSNTVDCVINCAAYTAVDQAESNVETAFEVNADAVKTLAKESYDCGADFIHISTDYVFNGEGKKPFEEDDLTQPMSVYGKSKLEGERLAMDYNPNAIIIRTAWVYSQYGHNFLKTMLRLFKEKEEIAVVNDQRGTPTNANDLARAILHILQAKDKPAGIYHYTNAGETTWFDFAMKIKELTHATIQINAIPTSAYPTPAKRPNYSVLSTQKIQDTFGVEVPSWEDSLKGLIGK